MHGLVVYIKEGLPFVRDLPPENSADSYLCFQLALLHSVSHFFFLYRSPSSSLCTVFDSVSSNIDEVLSINPSANVNIYHKDWLPILVELIDLVNIVLIFLSQMALLRWNHCLRLSPLQISNTLRMGFEPVLNPSSAFVELRYAGL